MLFYEFHTKAGGCEMFSTNIYEKFALPLSQSMYLTVLLSTVLKAICAVVSISGNLLVLLVYGKRALQRVHAPDLIVVNLAITDFVVGLLLLPSMIITDVFILCRQVVFFRAILESILMPFFSTVSIWTVFGASMDRLVSIKWPTEYKTLVSQSRVRKGIFFTWAFSSTWIWFPFLPGVIGKYLLMIRSFVGFCVATAIICCWISIYLVLANLNKVRAVQFVSTNKKTWYHSLKRKVAKMFFCVVMSLYLCYLPLWVRSIAHAFDALNVPQLEIFAITLVLANSCANPIIYCFTSKIFRKELFSGRKTKYPM